MIFLKWVWKIFLRLIVVPVIATALVMIVSLFFVNDLNQTTERGKEIDANYGTSYHQAKDIANENPTWVNKYNQYDRLDEKKYNRKQVDMQDGDFDTVSVISTVVLLGTFFLMLVYTVLEVVKSRKKSIQINH